MPKVFEWNGHRFFFFSNEGDPLEPVHIHVKKGSHLAKFWLEPEIRLSKSYGFNSKSLNQLSETINENRKVITEKWNDYFNL